MSRIALTALFAVLALACLSSSVVADPPEFQHPNTDWLTWTVNDAAGDPISLQGYNGSVYVVIFSASDEAASTMMSDLADHVRANPGEANKILAMCTDNSGAKALKRHIRQEEYKKRVAEWDSAQEAARQAAEQVNEEFVPEPIPDFVTEIEDELDDAQDLATLMAYHFPFNTGCRCDAMWDWLRERMTSPKKAPRMFKFNAVGVETGEWTAPFNVSQILGN